MTTSPAFDQYGTSISSGGNSATIAVTTGAAGELVLLAIEVGTASSGIPSTSVSGGSLSWTKLASVSQAKTGSVESNTTDVWAAVAASQLTAVTITCNVTVAGGGTIDDIAMLYAAFSGQSLAVYDPNVSVPATGYNTTSSGNQNKVTVSTSYANDVIFFVAGQPLGTVNASTPITGATKIGTAFNTGGTAYAVVYAQYQVYNSVQTNITVGTNQSYDNAQWIAIAITAGPAGTPAYTMFFA